MNMNNRIINWTTFVSVNGGFILGLNMAGISGAIPSLQEFYNLSDLALGMAVSSIMVGCLIGSLFAGSLSDKYGRKKLMIITAIIFVLSPLGCSLSQSLWLFILSRLILGIAVGSISVLSPTYISEIAPAEKRGALVSYNQLAVVIGILLAYLINFVLIRFEEGWRLMLAVPTVFSILLLVLLNISFPESPRWLLKVGHSDKAFNILNKIGGQEYAKLEIATISSASDNKKVDSEIHIKDLFRGKIGYIVLLGTLLAAFQQITGINAVINYAPTIFEKAGVSNDIALFQSIIVGLVNLLFTIVAIRLVDKKGRKPLLLWGAAGMAASLFILYLSFNSGSIIILISLLGYIAFFAASLAPVMWVVTTEMYPTRIRGVAMSFSTAISYVCALLVVQFFPWLLNNWGSFTFMVFTLLSLGAFIFIIFLIPETKGKSLEQIEADLHLRDVK